MSSVRTQFLDTLRSWAWDWQVAHCRDEPYVYQGPADFVLRVGKTYRVNHCLPGLPNLCFNNAIGYVLNEPDWRYVEGFAMMPLPDARFNVSGPEIVHHAWVVDHHGTPYEVTWPRPGRVYVGVEFDVMRAHDATWNGDASVLDDYYRGHPLMSQEWKGEVGDFACPVDREAAAVICRTASVVRQLARGVGLRVGSPGSDADRLTSTSRPRPAVIGQDGRQTPDTARREHRGPG